MRFIFLALLVLLTTKALLAQKIEIGLNGGIGFGTAPSLPVGSSYNYKPEVSRISPIGAIRASFIHGKWQEGIEISALRLVYDYYFPGGYYYVKGGMILPITPSQKNEVIISKPAVPIKLFMNRELVFNKIKVYTGISAGYVLVTGSKIHKDYQYNSHADYYPASGNGISAGIQLGVTYFINKRIGFNTEVCANYLGLRIGEIDYNILAIPATVGVRYRL